MKPTTILRLDDVKSRTGLSRSTIYVRIAEGEFPKPILLGPRAVGWLDTEIEDWVARRIRATRARVSDPRSPNPSL